MEKGKKYKLTFNDGTVTTVEVLDGGTEGFDNRFIYVEGEDTRPFDYLDHEDCFYLPDFLWETGNTYKEL